MCIENIVSVLSVEKHLQKKTNFIGLFTVVPGNMYDVEVVGGLSTNNSFINATYLICKGFAR